MTKMGNLTKQRNRGVLLFLIERGYCKIEFVFRQKGVILGALLSMISMGYLIIQLRREKDEISSH